MNINSPFSEHKDRHNNPYYNVLMEDAKVIPLEDNYSEDSWPDKRDEDY